MQNVIPKTEPQVYDPETKRPARQYQWSFSIQREVMRDLLVEASYIGNQEIWWSSSLTPIGATPLVNYNFLSTAILSHYKLSLNNPADLTTLLTHLNSATTRRFQNQLPFANFPLTAT